MSNVLFAISGSIACMKAAQVVSSLVQRGHQVQVVATASALRFVGSATWEGLTNRHVLSDTFEEGNQMDHIHLARWADVFVLCPASANAIASFANGHAGDLPSTMFLAFERHKPVLIAPAMNKEMWTHPAVQKNLATLAEWNLRILQPEAGTLACGEIGAGRLQNPETIVRAIENARGPSASPQDDGATPQDDGASPQDDGARHVLITAGGTREPIDGVRFITNFSSGSTGAFLADHLAAQGWQVSYLHGIGAKQPHSERVKRIEFSDFRNLQETLPKLLTSQKFEAIVHAAAVSDFSVDQIRSGDREQRVDGGERKPGKLSSDQALTITLKKNPKLVLNLKEWSQPSSPKVIAFKLTNTADKSERRAAVEKLLGRAEVDAVIANDLSEIDSGKHQGYLYSKNGGACAFQTKQEMAALIERSLV